ncbi:MAG: methyltransferase domain-containing protein [Gammaproteobacteria bacterium]|nr:methyltransferase domain-containing protein [Gammaproteobacteria bacterium]
MSEEEYSASFVAGLEWIWGEGFLSPGGPDEVLEILQGVDLTGKRVLDVGCGLGGADLLMVRDLHAAEVVGIDVEPAMVQRATEAARAANLAERLDFRLVTPGAVPFDDDSFDVVFSKDSMVHIEDKRACYADLARVLKPGGVLAVGDWFGSSTTATAEMRQWLDVVGLNFELGTLGEAVDLLCATGFSHVSGRDRNRWYAEYMEQELAPLAGVQFERLAEKIGQEAAEQRLASSSLKQIVVLQGQLRPGHLHATS